MMDYGENNIQNNAPFDRGPERIDPFSIASLVCGFLSLTLCCLGVFSVSFGALGILFALLTKRSDKPMPTLSRTGLSLSVSGIAFGIIMCVYTVYMILTDPLYRNTFEKTYQQYYKYYNESSGYNYNIDEFDLPISNNNYKL